MADLYISEFSGTGIQQGVSVFSPKEPALANQKVSFTTATDSSALNAKTRLVRLLASATAYVNFAGTATASSERLEANTEYVRAVNGGETISVYDGTS